MPTIPITATPRSASSARMREVQTGEDWVIVDHYLTHPPREVNAQAHPAATRRQSRQVSLPSRLREGLGVGMLGSAQSRLQIGDQVKPFPREEIAVGLAPKMAVGGGRLVDRLVEAKMRADRARGQTAELGDAEDRGLDLVVAHRAGVVGVDIEAERLRHADRIGNLDRAARGKPR